MVEPGAAAVVAALVAHALHQLPLLLGMREDDPALAGRELLVRVEAEHARNAVRADRMALVLGAQGLGGILDQHQPVPVADRPDLVELARVAEHVDCHDRLRALGDRRLERGRIEVQRARVDIGEDRRRALEDEAVRRGDERERRGDHLVSRPEPGDVARAGAGPRCRSRPQPQTARRRARRSAPRNVRSSGRARAARSAAPRRRALPPARPEAAWRAVCPAMPVLKLRPARAWRSRATGPSARCGRARCPGRPPGSRA